jgi:hypothetical protein
MILRAIEHSVPWERLQTLLDEILVAMSRFDCQRALQLLGEAVAEYKPVSEPYDLIWTRQSTISSDDRKVTNLKARRITRHTGPSSTGPSDNARP